PQVQAIVRSFELLREQAPSRPEAQAVFDTFVRPAYPNADFGLFANVLTRWGRMIHAPAGGARVRPFPQSLLQQLLTAFRLFQGPPDDGAMQDIGVFSKIMQDVEAVYLSVDSVSRFREILNFLSNVAESGYDSSTAEVLQRPDAVTVSTVHKMKGLEFPVVCI